MSQPFWYPTFAVNCVFFRTGKVAVSVPSLPLSSPPLPVFVIVIIAVATSTIIAVK